MKARFHEDVASLILSEGKVANWTTKQSPKNPVLPIFSTYLIGRLSKFAIKHQNVMSLYFSSEFML